MTIDGCLDGGGMVFEVSELGAGGACYCSMPGCIIAVACLAGDLKLQMKAGEAILLHSGDTCLLPAHAEFCVSGSNGTQAARLVMDAGYLMDRFADILAISPDLFHFIEESRYASSADATSSILVRGVKDASFTCGLATMLRESRERDPLYERVIACEVERLVILLARRSDLQVAHDLEKLTADDIVSYLSDNMATATLANTAETFSYHPNSISRILRRELGLSFSEVMGDLRLTRARELIEGSTIAISDIAATCGYANMTNFYRAFQKRFGTSPGDCRKGARLARAG